MDSTDVGSHVMVSFSELDTDLDISWKKGISSREWPLSDWLVGMLQGIIDLLLMCEDPLWMGATTGAVAEHGALESFGK